MKDGTLDGTENRYKIIWSGHDIERNTMKMTQSAPHTPVNNSTVSLVILHLIQKIMSKILFRFFFLQPCVIAYFY